MTLWWDQLLQHWSFHLESNLKLTGGGKALCSESFAHDLRDEMSLHPDTQLWHSSIPIVWTAFAQFRRGKGRSRLNKHLRRILRRQRIVTWLQCWTRFPLQSIQISLEIIWRMKDLHPPRFAWDHVCVLSRLCEQVVLLPNPTYPLCLSATSCE